jgi:hypothetical protein
MYAYGVLDKLVSLLATNDKRPDYCSRMSPRVVASKEGVVGRLFVLALFLGAGVTSGPAVSHVLDTSR